VSGWGCISNSQSLVESKNEEYEAEIRSDRSMKYKQLLYAWRVAHTCNPSYSGCRDWEDQGLRTAQAKT
jgi:hypothetical protein